MTSSKPDTVADLHSSVVKYIVGGLAGLLLSALTVFFRHFAKPTYQTIVAHVRKDAVIQIAAISILALLLALIWLFLLYRERKTPLTEKYGFDEYGGFYVDRKHGWAICPRCLSDGKVVHMMDVGGNKKCNACDAVCRGKSR